MTTFANHTKSNKPLAVHVFPPTIWRDGYEKHPHQEVAIGIRLAGDYEYAQATADAAQLAWRLHPSGKDREIQIEIYNNALFREICAKCMCDPNDVSKRYFSRDVDEVEEALTTEGVKAIYDEIEKVRIQTSPVHAEASDEDLTELAECIHLVDLLPAWRAARARRLLSFVLEELRTLDIAEAAQ